MEIHVLLSHGRDHFLPVVSILGTIVFLYIGPDQLLPLASFVGAAIGVILIVWHRAVSLARKVWHFFSKK